MNKISMHRRLGIFCAAFLLAGLWGCAPVRKGAPPPTPTIETPVPPTQAATPAVEGRAVFWRPAPEEDILAAAQFLQGATGFPVIAVFPKNTFKDDEKSRQARDIFIQLVAEEKLEIALVLANDPPLALLQDTAEAAKLSRPKINALPPRFAWPEDPAGHLAQGRAQFRRQWQNDPTGMVMPTGVVAGPEIPLIDRAKIQWLVLPFSTAASAGYFAAGDVVVLRPVVFSTGTPAENQRWLSDWESQPAGPAVLTLSLHDLKVFHAAWVKHGKPALVPMRGVIRALDQGSSLTPLSGPPNLTPWIGDSQENTAWRLLGETRQALEAYKNSGKADIKKLDVAFREIYKAEGGRYFYYFGNDFSTGRDIDLEREFLATLAQVHRLMGEPVPPVLTRGFSAASFSSAGSGGDQETTFQKSTDVWRWTDADKDDRGPGDFFYPSGAAFAPGSWDLNLFQVGATPETISLTFSFAALPNPWGAPEGFSFPLVDVYIDINHLPGAGADSLLPGRPGLVESQNAWEYAVSVSGWGGAAYQYVPGAPAREMAKLSVRRGDVPRSFTVDVPRRFLRGSPDQWGFGVAVMGAQPNNPGAPMPVQKEPSATSFGLSQDATVAEAPPYVDLLAPPGQRQSQILSAYKQGRVVVIPFVREE